MLHFALRLWWGSIREDVRRARSVQGGCAPACITIRVYAPVLWWKQARDPAHDDLGRSISVSPDYGVEIGEAERAAKREADMGATVPWKMPSEEPFGTAEGNRYDRTVRPLRQEHDPGASLERLGG